MAAIIRIISVLCLCLSLAVGLSVVLWDVVHGFNPLAIHQRGMALALMLVGASYAMAHLPGPMRFGERIRAISLGSAFVLWGMEQFLPVGRLSVAADCVLIVVFVVDLSLAVKTRLGRGD